ncbi:MAG: hypothetical protein V5A74_04560 [Desulfohalobiaceae bacterium]
MEKEKCCKTGRDKLAQRRNAAALEAKILALHRRAVAGKLKEASHASS